METDFASVWSRVTGTSADTPETQLRRFLKQKAEFACALKSAASLACDAVIRRKLTELYSENCRQMKRLRAALYLLAGECECPAIQKRDAPRSLPEALKQLYESADRAASGFRRAAGDTDRPALETLYAALADETKQQADCLLRLTERLF